VPGAQQRVGGRRHLLVGIDEVFETRVEIGRLRIGVEDLNG
jgi:hypothetical protein